MKKRSFILAESAELTSRTVRGALFDAFGIKNVEKWRQKVNEQQVDDDWLRLTKPQFCYGRTVSDQNEKTK